MIRKKKEKGKEGYLLPPWQRKRRGSEKGTPSMKEKKGELHLPVLLLHREKREGKEEKKRTGFTWPSSKRKIRTPEEKERKREKKKREKTLFCTLKEKKKGRAHRPYKGTAEKNNLRGRRRKRIRLFRKREEKEFLAVKGIPNEKGEKGGRGRFKRVGGEGKGGLLTLEPEKKQAKDRIEGRGKGFSRERGVGLQLPQEQRTGKGKKEDWLPAEKGGRVIKEEGGE